VTCPDCGAKVVEAMYRGGSRANPSPAPAPAFFEHDDDGRTYIGRIGNVVLALRWARDDEQTYSLHRCSRIVDVQDLRAIQTAYATRKPPRVQVRAIDDVRVGDRLTLREGDERVRGTVTQILMEVAPDAAGDGP